MLDSAEFSRRALELERPLYRVARGVLRRPQDCADAVQEALLKAWAARASLRQPEYFKTWLTRILINECKTMLRRKHPLLPLEALPETAAEESGCDVDLERALYALPEKYRIVVVMHYREGYSVEEIAAVLRVPAGTVKARLSRARARLRQELRDEEVCLI